MACPESIEIIKCTDPEIIEVDAVDSIEIVEADVVHVLVQGSSGVENFRGEILPTDLVGPYAIVPHNLNQEIVDVTVFDDEGALALPWAPFDLNRVQINFSGLAPITKTYKILVEV